MPQYNMHKELNTFYENHVRLKEEISRLRGLRDTNLTRLAEGLAELKKPNFSKNLLQGSIAMHTANRSVNNDYDIDIAVIFEEGDLPASPLEARKRVAEAIKLKASGFSKDPEARTNAVTIWYADGYHVDVAVYRRRETLLRGEVLEHAGADWSERNPQGITNWFIDQVSNQSPSKNLLSSPDVAPQQMRRVVRWIKAFTKAREGWNLPGGLIVSALVAECYKRHPDKDDIALYDTLRAIKNRLDVNCSVYNPVDSSKELTDKQKFTTQVQNLKRRLGSVLSKLDVLFGEDCTDMQAKKAWNYMFKHAYWQPATQQTSKAAANDQNYGVTLNMGVAKARNGSLTGRNIPSGRFIPKKVHLRFEAQTNVPTPYTVTWRAVNTGDEAEAANDMGHLSTSDSLAHWEHTAYRGQHKLVCEISKNGDVIATTTHVVNVR